jgi:hypothetical protein
MITFLKTKNKENGSDKSEVKFIIDDDDIDITRLKEEFNCFCLAIGYHPESVNKWGDNI